MRSRPDLQVSFVPPHTPLEATLADLWAQLLGIERVGIHNNFFYLGGHSLLVTQMIAQPCETLQLELAIHGLFETPTITDLTQRIETLLWAAQRTPALVDQLGDDIEEGVL